MSRLLSGFLTVFLLAAACSQAPAGSSGDTAPAAGLSFETILQRSFPGQSGRALREVVRDREAWQAAWAALREGSELPAEPPEVDFSRQMVILAALETQSCISRITVRSVTRAAGALVVDILEAPPAPNCICLTSERAVHVVRLERVDLPERFEVERGVTSCG